MTKQTINVGATANDKKGDSLRAAFQKVNANFNELYTALGLADTTLNLGNFVFEENTIRLTNANNDDSTATQIEIAQPVRIESDLTIGGDLLPNRNLGGNLGSPTQQWKSLYVSTSTIYINNIPLSISENNVLTIDGNQIVTSGTDTAFYNINGTEMSNADDSHGATATVKLPANGDSVVPLLLQNNYGAVSVSTGTDPGNTHGWIFKSDGDLQLPVGGDILDSTGNSVLGGGGGTGNISFLDTTIYAPEGSPVVIEGTYSSEYDGIMGSKVEVEGNSGRVLLSGYSLPDTNSFDNNAWGTAEWTIDGLGNPVVVFLEAPDLLTFMLNTFLQGYDKHIRINGGNWKYFSSGISSGPDNSFSFGLDPEDTPPAEGTVITQFEVKYQRHSYIDLNSDDAIRIKGRGLDIEIESTIGSANLKGGDWAQIQAGAAYVWVESGSAYVEVESEGAGSSTFQFDHDNGSPKLRLPPNADIVDAENNSVLGGGGNTGDVNFDGTTIYGPSNAIMDVYAQDGDDNIKASLRLDPGEGYPVATLQTAYTNDSTFYDDAWTGSAQWIANGGGGRVDFTSETLKNFLQNTLIYCDRITIEVNGQNAGQYFGANTGPGYVQFNVENPPVESPDTVVSIKFTYDEIGKVVLDHNDGSLEIDGGTGLEVRLKTRQSINLRANGKDWTFDTAGNLNLPNGGAISTNYGYIDQDSGFDNNTLRLSGGDSVSIYSNEDGKRWLFDSSGDLTLPAGGDILNSNGDSVLGAAALTDDKEVKVTVGNTDYFALISRAQQGDNSGVSPQAVAYDGDGNMIALHVSNYDTGNDKLIISKFSDTGELSWQKQLNNHDVDTSVSADLVIFDDNSMVITFTIDSYGTTDRDSIAVMKLDDEGGLVWSKVLTGNEPVEITESVIPEVNGIGGITIEGTDYQIVFVSGNYDYVNYYQGWVFQESTDGTNWTTMGTVSLATYDGEANTTSLLFPDLTFAGNLDYPTKSYRVVTEQVNSWHETSAITTDGDDVFVIAEYQDGASGPNLTKAAILKLAGTNGNLIWAKVLDAVEGNTEMYGADVGADGHIVAVGYVASDGPGITISWINKFDGTTGDYIWGTVIAANEIGQLAAGGDIVVDSQNNVFVTLNTREDIVSDQESVTKTIAYVVKIDSTGDIVWSRRVGPGPCASVASGIDCDSTGNVYLSVLTITQDNPVRDVNEFGNSGKTTMALAKYSTDGEVLWQRYIESDHYYFIGYDDIEDTDNDFDFNYNRARNLSLGPNGKLAIQGSVRERDSDDSWDGNEYKQGVVLQIDQDGREMTIGSGSDKFTVRASRIPGKFVTLNALEGSAEGVLTDLTEDVLVVTPTLTFVDAELAQVRSTSAAYEYVFGNDGTLTIPNDGDIKLTQTQIGWFSIFGKANNYNDDVWFRANCVDPSTGDVYAVGQDDDTNDGIIVRYNSQGQVVWSIKLNDVTDGNNTRCNAVKIHPTNGNVVVLCEYYGNQVGTLFLQIDPETARVVVSAGFRDAGEGGDAIPYDFAFDGAGNIIVVGRKWDEYRQISVSPGPGSGVGLMIINKSSVTEGPLPITNSWYMYGTGITGRTTIQYVNRYTGLTGTTREGTGAVFSIVIGGAGPYTYDSVTATTAGTNYRVGHKILVDGAALEGLSGTNNATIEVTGVDGSGGITSATISGTYGNAQAAPYTYTGVTGTNYNVGSGFQIDIDYSNTTDYNGAGTYNLVGGSNYVVGDVITVPGTLLGGTTPTNDMTVTVATINGSGAVTDFTRSGTAQDTTVKIQIAESVDFGTEGEWSVAYALGGEAFVYKADDEFVLLWKKVLSAGGAYDTERYLSVAVGSDNAIYAAGEMVARNNVAGADLNSYWCAVVSKFASDGTHAWTKALNTTLNDSYAKCVSVQGTNTVVVSHQNTGNGSTVITKLDAAGNVKWQRETNSNDDSSVAVDTNGDIYAVVEAQFENRYENCIKLIKFNAAGEIAYRKFFGTLVYDLGGTNEYFKNGRNLTLDGDNLYISGYTTAFDNDYDNSFLVKLPKSANCEGSYSGWVLQNDIYNVDKITSTEAAAFAPVIGIGEFEDWTPDFNTDWWDPSDNDEYHTLAEIVDRDGGAIEFADGTRQTSSAQQIPQRKIFNGADHRLQPEDSGKHIFVTNSDTSIVVPYDQDSPLPIGFTVVVINDSGGVINIDADGGLINIRNSSDGNTSNYWDLAGYGMATLIKVGENYWYISGNVSDDG